MFLGLNLKITFDSESYSEFAQIRGATREVAIDGNWVESGTDFTYSDYCFSIIEEEII